jgi:hypothetical protein
MSSPFQRPGDSPQAEGRRFESIWAKLFGVDPVKGSGNQWHSKLDVGTSAISFSLKHSTVDRLRFGQMFIKSLMKEAREGAGADAVPALALSENGTVYVVFEASDFLRLAQTGDIHYVTPSKGEQKRARAQIPSLLRDEEDLG